MKKMNLKRVIKIISIVVLLFVTILVAAPFVFKEKIKATVLTAINENLTAKVAFDDVDLSFIRNFPQAALVIENLKIINNAPFENDTLVFVKELGLTMSIKDFLRVKTNP